MPGGFEIVILVLVILLFFGAKRIPELARGLGQGINEFRKASDDIKKEIDKGNEDVNKTTKPPTQTKEPASKEETKSDPK